MQMSILFAAGLVAAAALAVAGGRASLVEPNQQPVNANDLQAVGAPPADHLQDVYHFVDQNNQRYAIPAAVYRVRPKQRSADSGRTVINGNHATYVEPPADFKPIIYEPEKQPVAAAAAAGDLQSFDSSPAASAPASSQETSQQQQLAAPVSVSGLSRQQLGQHQYQLAINQQQAQQRAPSAEAGPRSPQSEADSAARDQLGADEISLEGPSGEGASSTPLKAPIGRWSDWHDMSVEPDLASSDSDSSQAAYYLAAPGHQSPRPLDAAVAPSSGRPQLPSGADAEPTNYRTRYGSTKGAFFAPARQPQALYNPVFHPPGQLIKGHQQQQQHQHQHHLLLHQRQPASSQSEQQPAIKGQIDEQQQDHLLQAHHRALDLNSQQPAALSSSSSSLAATPMMPMPFNPNNHYDHRRQLESQTRLSGAGNLIRMQVVAENMAPLSVPSLLSSSSPAKEANTKWDHIKLTGGQQQQQQHRQQPPPSAASQSRRLKRRRKSKTNAEVRIQQLALPETGPAGQLDRRPSGQLTPTRQQAKQVDLQAVSSPNGAPVARLLASPNEQRVLDAQRASTARPAQVRKPTGGVVKRAVQKKRPIRTLQPVGLTSWFLGGVRDLDGRHWRLPAEVISKLAVNDVDLHHEQAGADQPAQAQQVNEVERATVSSSSAPTSTLRPNAIPR